MSAECEYLDAFLADGLSPDDRELYEGHLIACESCRETLNRQIWIDALLNSPVRLELEPVAPALAGSVRESIASRRRQARLIACGFTAAAVLVVAVGWTALVHRQSNDSASGHTAAASFRDDKPVPDSSLQGREIEEQPRAVCVGGPDVLAVPVASRHPNVTIVRVYPTYRSDLATQAVDDDSDADYFNGG